MDIGSGREGGVVNAVGEVVDPHPFSPGRTQPDMCAWVILLPHEHRCAMQRDDPSHVGIR